MKKFTTRLFSLLAVFCLVFFSVPFRCFSADVDVSLYPYKYSFHVSFPNGGFSDGTYYYASKVPCLALLEYDSHSYRALFVPSVNNDSCSDGDVIKLNSDGSYNTSLFVDSNSLISGFRYFKSTNSFSSSISLVLSEFVGFKYLGPYFDSVASRTQYVKNNIGSPSPITPSLDSGLGSFVLGSNNAWANRVYGNNEYHGSFMTILRDTTTTGYEMQQNQKWGTDFDTLQYYTGVDHFTRLRVVGNNDDLGSFMSDTISVASDSQLTNGRGGHHFTVTCPDSGWSGCLFGFAQPRFYGREGVACPQCGVVYDGDL